MNTTTARPANRDEQPDQATRLRSAEQRLAAIAARLHPCPAPDTTEGFDRCPCGRGSWPCAVTEAEWLARGLDPYNEVRRILDDQLTAAGWHQTT